MKFLLFGTGDYYDRYKKWFPKEDVVALLDNSLTKQGTCLDDIPIVSPKEGVQLPFDHVVILSFYVEEMRNQLKHLGVSEDRICHFFDLRFLLHWKERKMPVQYDGKAEEVLFSRETKKEKILLLSHDLNLGGPALALYHAAKSLRKSGYEVIYGSMLDGPLKEKLLVEQIPVVVDCNLQMETMREADWLGSFSLLICNTISYYVFLSERNTKIPVIWDSSSACSLWKIRPFTPSWIYAAVPAALEIRQGTPCIMASAAAVGIGSSLDGQIIISESSKI